MKNEDWLSQQIAEVEGTHGYELERLVLQIQEQLVDRMEKLDVNRSSLAKRMGVGRWSVSRLFNKVANVELKTLVSAACALDSRLMVIIEPIARRLPAKVASTTQIAEFYGGKDSVPYGATVLPFASAQKLSIDQTFTSETAVHEPRSATA